jgi:putative tryptophan/tyrosine transport system substrate-binding protein
MRRRTFIAGLGGAVAWPVAARAQQPGRIRRIGVLASLPLPPLQRFAQKLQQLGYSEDRNLQIEYRFAEGHDDQYPILAEQLVGLPVDLIVTWGTPAALAAKQATAKVPIIMGAVGEAVNTGIVTNLARPGGNITGFAAVNVELDSKRLEILKELLPHLTQVGILANASNPLLGASLISLRPTAQTLGLILHRYDITNANEIESVLQRLMQEQPDGVLVAADTLLLTKRAAITAALAKSNIPGIYPFREYAEVGGLIIHGANLGVLFERAADYADRILKGEKPGDLPVQQATEFELIINLKTAMALGLSVPPTLLARADEVVE